MTWDTTKPADTDWEGAGASRIRELKTDLANAFTMGDMGFDISNAANPALFYNPPYDTQANRPVSSANRKGRLFINQTTATIDRDRGDGINWDQVATLFPSGTVCVFYQAAAPTGWTQVVTQNDKVFRVVSGAGGGAGGTDPVSAPTKGTLGVSVSDSGHTHSTPNHSHTLDDDGGNFGVVGTTPVVKGAGGTLSSKGSGSTGNATAKYTTTSGGGSTTGSGSANVSGSVTGTPNPLAYVNVIICSKN